MSIDVGGMRTPYKGTNESFSEDQLVSRDPIDQFHNWFQIARETKKIEEPNAMCLSTATKEGRPSARMVLMKGYGQDGFKFFTNYQSRKAREMNENPFVSLTFFWEPLRRSVRIEGHVEKLSVEESVAYFDTRPLKSRISAVVSPQSQPISSRDDLTAKVNDLTALAEENPDHISKPDNWGGFLVIPDSIEFWQGQTTRLHDRIRFRKPKSGEVVDNHIVKEGLNGWVFERLAP